MFREGHPTRIPISVTGIIAFLTGWLDELQVIAHADIKTVVRKLLDVAGLLKDKIAPVVPSQLSHPSLYLYRCPVPCIQELCFLFEVFPQGVASPNTLDHLGSADFLDMRLTQYLDFILRFPAAC